MVNFHGFSPASETVETWWTSFHNPTEAVCYGSRVCQLESSLSGTVADLSFVPFDYMKVR